MQIYRRQLERDERDTKWKIRRVTQQSNQFLL